MIHECTNSIMGFSISRVSIVYINSYKHNLESSKIFCNIFILGYIYILYKRT